MLNEYTISINWSIHKELLDPNQEKGIIQGLFDINIYLYDILV